MYEDSTQWCLLVLYSFVVLTGILCFLFPDKKLPIFLHGYQKHIFISSISPMFMMSRKELLANCSNRISLWPGSVSWEKFMIVAHEMTMWYTLLRFSWAEHSDIGYWLLAPGRSDLSNQWLPRDMNSDLRGFKCGPYQFHYHCEIC